LIGGRVVPPADKGLTAPLDANSYALAEIVTVSVVVDKVVASLAFAVFKLNSWRSGRGTDADVYWPATELLFPFTEFTDIVISA
jgi:hypothetical protein